MKCCCIPSQTSDSSPKSGFEQIIDFFNELEVNKPVTIAEVVEKTNFSWSFVKKTLKKLSEEEYCGFHFEKSGSTWISWKDRDKILPKMEDTCSRFLDDD
ncbi:MAG: hypothetical protein GF383_08275 [Candidatus Lokiarchaeota archaeon]|nr:hypothetical protein [Candidatus Lokiarchaeota archaeon]MBD3340347.1 hypothetical protein [Candidatus Lokiarchaeota archaeon]